MIRKIRPTSVRVGTARVCKSRIKVCNVRTRRRIGRTTIDRNDRPTVNECEELRNGRWLRRENPGFSGRSCQRRFLAGKRIPARYDIPASRKMYKNEKKKGTRFLSPGRRWSQDGETTRFLNGIADEEFRQCSRAENATGRALLLYMERDG